jgi:probable phosphoglycerate mutase
MVNPNRFDQHPFTPPAGATELVIVRHGSSAAAEDGSSFPLLDGRGNPDLAPAGLVQANLLGEHLAEHHIDAIFVSSLVRTQQTARPLRDRVGLEARVVPDLAEVFLGDFEGGEYRIRAAGKDPVVERAFAEERWDVIPGAEPADAFAARIARAIELIVRETGPSKRAAVFAHGGVIGEICRQVTGSRPFAFVHSDNGSITQVVVPADGRPILRAFNETAHLAAARGESA